MKQHAVPQEIMSVEFNLFGSMNIRQFGYVASAGALAYFTYLILPGFLGWIGAGFMILLGLGLAFAPGFDVTVTNFILTLKRPTRRVWKKTPKPPDFMLDLPIEAYSIGLSLSSSKLDTGGRESRVFSSLVEEEDDEIAKEVASVDNELQKLQDELKGSSKEELVEAKEDVKDELAITKTPNVINGVLLGENGSPLPNEIVNIFDSLGRNVASVKTNSQGIFLMPTPLPLGKYSVNYVVEGVTRAFSGVVINGDVLSFIKLVVN